MTPSPRSPAAPLSPTALAASWRRARDALGADGRRLGLAALRAIAAGERPTLPTLAGRLGWDSGRARRAWEALDASGLGTSDGDAVTGAMGLTHLPTRHALALAGRPLFTWCALDAVGIPAALGADAEVQSAREDDGGVVAFVVRAGVPVGGEDVEVFVPDPAEDATFVDDACPEINFYGRGRAPRRPDAGVLTLAEAAALGRLVWEEPRDGGGA